ncbi:MAG: hypothetical protein IJU05_01370 [Schwartzia sp.]|nr:hypothetical protein [Schwartzia sp. (in: firmicutes)]
MTRTHYRLSLKVEKEAVRTFYSEECVKAGWSTRQLERQINSFFHERLLAGRSQQGRPSGREGGFLI